MPASDVQARLVNDHARLRDDHARLRDEHVRLHDEQTCRLNARRMVSLDQTALLHAHARAPDVLAE